MQQITSTHNERIAALRALSDKRERDRTGLFLVEGVKMVREAAGCVRVETALVDAEQAQALAPLTARLQEAGAQVLFAAPHVFRSVSDAKTPQGILAAVRMPAPGGRPKGARLVALDGVQDPGNVGTIWRTADAAGFGALLLGEGSADPLSPKVLRAAMGSGFRLPFGRAEPLGEALDALSARGYSIIASALDGDDFYRRPDPGRRIALVVGNEARGIRPEILARADYRLKLPMRGGAESLNAAVAAGIFMYDLINARQ